MADTRTLRKMSEKVAVYALKVQDSNQSLAETVDVVEALLRDEARSERRYAESAIGGDRYSQLLDERADRLYAIADTLAKLTADLEAEEASEPF